MYLQEPNISPLGTLPSRKTFRDIPGSPVVETPASRKESRFNSVGNQDPTGHGAWPRKYKKRKILVMHVHHAVAALSY